MIHQISNKNIKTVRKFILFGELKICKMEENIKEKKQLLDFHKKQVDKMIRNKEPEKIFAYLQENIGAIKYDNDLMAVWYLGKIVQKELEAGGKTVFEKEDSLENLLGRYRQFKFFLRRIENDILENANEFFSFLSEKAVSEYELMGMVDSVIHNKEKVWKYFQRV